MRTTIILIMTALISISALNAQPLKSKPVVQKLQFILDHGALADLYRYDTREAVQRVKIRDRGKRAAFEALLHEYNLGIEVLREQNLSNVAAFGKHVVSLVRERQYGSILTARRDYRHGLKDLENGRRGLYRHLESGLEEVLTRRQLRRWMKYEEEMARRRIEIFQAADLLKVAGL